MKFTTFIPKRLNDGTPVSQDEFREIFDLIHSRFGGCTIEDGAIGHWIDPADGVLYEDSNLRVSVACDNDQYELAKQTVIEIGKRLAQKAMYFEVQYLDGVQFLECE